MLPSTQKTMFSSASEDWATPRDLAGAWVKCYDIKLDVCASAENAVVPKFFDKATDGLSQEWTGACWMNPPYGRGIGKWVAKAANSAKKGATVVCLLPSRTDTKWWHEYCQPILDGSVPGRVFFVKGRLHFNESKAGAPFPSVIVAFKPW